LPYLVPHADAIDISDSFANTATWEAVDLNKGAVFVFIPERMDELALVQQTQPNGEHFNYFSPVNNRLIATLYVLPPAVP
jgi:hypothetical protein